MGRKSERWAERLLDAAAGHASWETVGQELRDALGTPLAGVQLRDELGRPVEVALALDVEPAALRAYAEEFHAEDPHGPAMLGRSAYEVVDSDSLLPRRELMRSRYYQEWMVPSGMDRFLGFWAPFEDGTIGAAFLRAPGSEPFGTAERALVASLARPLARAVEVQARLRRAEAPRAGSASSGARPQHATTSALADVVATGLAVVDRAGVVLEANAAARELLRSLDRIPAHTPVELRAIALRNGGFFVQLEEHLISVVVRPAAADARATSARARVGLPLRSDASTLGVEGALARALRADHRGVEGAGADDRRARRGSDRDTPRDRQGDGARALPAFVPEGGRATGGGAGRDGVAGVAAVAVMDADRPQRTTRSRAPALAVAARSRRGPRSRLLPPRDAAL